MNKVNLRCFEIYDDMKADTMHDRLNTSANLHYTCSKKKFVRNTCELIRDDINHVSYNEIIKQTMNFQCYSHTAFTS